MDSRTLLYIGCYDDDSRIGIHIFDAEPGPLTAIGAMSGIDNPSFITAHPSGGLLYAVSETSNGSGDGGSVVSLALAPSDGSLTIVQDVPSGGDGSGHLSVEANGEYLWAANYVSGSVSGHRLEPDGRIGDLVFRRRHEGVGPSHRQEVPHAHCTVPHPHRPGFVVADLGIDRIIHCAVDGDVDDQLQLAPGLGPRHLVWHPHLPFCFVVGELDNTVTVIEFETLTGRLSSTSTMSTLPRSIDHPSLAAEVRINREGTRVYASNRGHDSIATFGFSDGGLELLAIVPSGGRGPRSLSLHPGDGSLVVANQGRNSLNRFAIGPGTGVLNQMADSHEVTEPACVTLVEVGS